MAETDKTDVRGLFEEIISWCRGEEEQHPLVPKLARMADAVERDSAAIDAELLRTHQSIAIERARVADRDAQIEKLRRELTAQSAAGAERNNQVAVLREKNASLAAANKRLAEAASHTEEAQREATRMAEVARIADGQRNSARQDIAAVRAHLERVILQRDEALSQVSVLRDDRQFFAREADRLVELYAPLIRAARRIKELRNTTGPDTARAFYLATSELCAAVGTINVNEVATAQAAHDVEPGAPGVRIGQRLLERLASLEATLVDRGDYIEKLRADLRDLEAALKAAHDTIARRPADAAQVRAPDVYVVNYEEGHGDAARQKVLAFKAETELAEARKEIKRLETLACDAIMTEAGCEACRTKVVELERQCGDLAKDVTTITAARDKVVDDRDREVGTMKGLLRKAAAELLWGQPTEARTLPLVERMIRLCGDPDSSQVMGPLDGPLPRLADSMGALRRAGAAASARIADRERVAAEEQMRREAQGAFVDPPAGMFTRDEAERLVSWSKTGHRLDSMQVMATPNATPNDAWKARLQVCHCGAKHVAPDGEQLGACPAVGLMDVLRDLDRTRTELAAVQAELEQRIDRAAEVTRLRTDIRAKNDRIAELEQQLEEARTQGGRWKAASESNEASWNSCSKELANALARVAELEKVLATPTTISTYYSAELAKVETQLVARRASCRRLAALLADARRTVKEQAKTIAGLADRQVLRAKLDDALRRVHNLERKLESVRTLAGGRS